jgi:hypothetical protein
VWEIAEIPACFMAVPAAAVQKRRNENTGDVSAQHGFYAVLLFCFDSACIGRGNKV